VSGTLESTHTSTAAQTEIERVMGTISMKKGAQRCNNINVVIVRIETHLTRYASKRTA